MNHLAIAPILLPLLAAIALLAIPGRAMPSQRLLGAAAGIGLVVLAVMLLRAVGGGEVLVYTLGNWPAPYGIVLVADRLSAWMVLITSLLGLSALLYSMREVDQRGRYFHTLFQLQLFGLNGAFLTGDLFNLFVFFEILLLASYGLLLHGGGRQRTRAGLHFVVINLAGSTLFLFAVGTLYGLLGTLNMADLAVRVAATPVQDIGLVKAAGMLLFVVFALKGALLPLHLWLPAAYAHTSAPVAALFAVMTKVGAYAILRFHTLVFGERAGDAAHFINAWLLPLALATLVVGMLGAVASRGLRRQIAYLVVSSVGFLLTAFALGSVAGIATGLYYLPHTTFAAGALFLLADSIRQRRGAVLDRFEPGPEIANSRVIGGLFFVLAVLIVGLPPLSGFLGKFLLLQASLEHSATPWIMASVLLTSLLGLIALARAGSLLFYRPQPAAGGAEVRHVSGTRLAAELTPAMGLTLLCLALTIWAGSVTDFTTATAEQLLSGEHYIRAVLGDIDTGATQ